MQPSGHDLYTRLGVGAFFCWKLNMAGPASHLARWRELSAPYCRTKRPLRCTFRGEVGQGFLVNHKCATSKQKAVAAQKPLFYANPVVHTQ